MGVPLRVRRAVEKNWPDLRVLLTGLAPRFVYGGRRVRGVPVFVYHRVGAELERDLERLAAGGYRTAGAEELEALGRARIGPESRVVALTFDDGDASLIRTAVPLLKRFGMRALAFVVPGYVPERTDDRRAGWRELNEAVREGVLQVGSHSLYHHHVPVTPRIRDFVRPDTDTDFTANVPIPRLRGDEPVLPGAPIFQGAPRYAARRAFRPDPEVTARCVELARAEGPELFRRREGRRRLRQVAGQVRGVRETVAEAEEEVLRDMTESLRIVSDRCPNPAARHLCYPWYIGPAAADRLAARAGFRAVHKGIDARHRPAHGHRPSTVRRLPPDFLGRLPGPDRLPLRELAARRLRTIAAGPLWGTPKA